MVDFKVVISNREGKSVQKEISDPNSRNLIGKKIGEVIKGETLGIAGYEFQITGGSDYCGFPMRRDVHGTGRKKIFAVAGVGIRKGGKGEKQRKTVCGNTIHPRISQVNLKILKQGKIGLFAKVQEKKAEEKKEEIKEKKEEVKKEKPEEKKEEEKPKVEEKKKEEVKEEPKEEKKEAKEKQEEKK